MLCSSLDALQALLRSGAVAEQAVENHARIDLHGKRRGGRAPGDRVHVGATEADVAGADQAAEILGRQFERRQRRLLADLLRRDLVDGDAGANVRAVGALGVNAVQENRGRARVVAAVIAGACGRGHFVRQIADHHQLVLERLKRRKSAREFQSRRLPPRASSWPSPRRAGMKHNPSRICGFAAVFASGVCAGIIESSSGSDKVTPNAAQKRAAGKCFLVISLMLASPQFRSTLCSHAAVRRLLASSSSETARS